MRKLFGLIAFSVLLLVSIATQNAFAAIVDDEASCTSLPALTTWNGNRCTLTSVMLVDTLSSDELRIPSTIIFEIAANGILQINTGDGVVNFGTMENKGQILSGNNILNKGTLVNTGDIINEGFISNTGTIDNLDTIDNSGIFTNTFDGPDIGVLDNSGLFINTGTLNNHILSITNLHGIIQNFNVFSNSGTINIFCGGEIQENQPDLTGTITLIPCNPDDQLVGGKLFPINSASLLLVGAKMTASWLAPVIITGIGIGLVLVRRK